MIAADKPLTPEETAKLQQVQQIRQVLDSQGNQANLLLRQVGVDLRSQGEVQIEMQNQRKQLQKGAGAHPQNPLIASEPEACWAANELIANRERLGRTTQYIALNSKDPNQPIVEERQTWGNAPGHIRVVDGGQYKHVVGELNRITGNVETFHSTAHSLS